MACGYVTNAKLGPSVATSEMGKPVLYDIYPITEKTTNPTKILEKLHISGTTIESLKKMKNSLKFTVQCVFYGTDSDWK